MSSARKQNLTIEQGVSWSHGWLVTVTGVPIDETWTARSQIRTKYGVLLHEFNVNVTPEGAVVLYVSPEESSAWDWFDAFYDVEVVNSDETVTLRVAQGMVFNSKEVTK